MTEVMQVRKVYRAEQWRQLMQQRKEKMPFICRLGARHNKQMVCPADLCHQWCHKFIVLVSLVELLHTIETATIETFDAGVLLRNIKKYLHI